MIESSEPPENLATHLSSTAVPGHSRLQAFSRKGLQVRHGQVVDKVCIVDIQIGDKFLYTSVEEVGDCNPRNRHLSSDIIRDWPKPAP